LLIPAASMRRRLSPISSSLCVWSLLMLPALAANTVAAVGSSSRYSRRNLRRRAAACASVGLQRETRLWGRLVICGVCHILPRFWALPGGNSRVCSSRSSTPKLGKSKVTCAGMKRDCLFNKVVHIFLMRGTDQQHQELARFEFAGGKTTFTGIFPAIRKA